MDRTTSHRTPRLPEVSDQEIAAEAAALNSAGISRSTGTGEAGSGLAAPSTTAIPQGADAAAAGTAGLSGAPGAAGQKGTTSGGSDAGGGGGAAGRGRQGP